SRLLRRLVPHPPAWTAYLTPLRIAGTFVLVHVGWLCFRETSLPMLLRDLTLTPSMSTPLDRQTGEVLLLRLVPYALPLVVQGLWVEWFRGRPDPFEASAESPALPGLLADGLLLGALLAAILVFRSQASLDFIYFQF